MAYVYEINGQRVEFEKEPTEADIDEAARQLGPAKPVEPPRSQVGEEAAGIATALAVPVAQAVQTVIENPIQSALGAYGTYKGARLANSAIQALNRVGTPATPAPTAPAPVAPAPATPAAPATSPILDAQGRPMVRTPVAPSAPAPAAPQAQASVMDKAKQVIRQLAANRVMPTPTPMMKGGLGVTLSLVPGNIGQNYPFPQSGPMRGQEINPSTGRPWTKQELDAYRAQYGG